MIFGRKRRQKRITEKSQATYLERLKKIESFYSKHSEIGPDLWNIKLGQSDFLGYVKSGAYKGFYIILEVEGIATQGTKREKSLIWEGLGEDDLISEISGFWFSFLRSSENQTPLEDDEFRLRKLDEVKNFLESMDISWYPAVQTLELLEGDTFWSPDWKP